MAKPFEAARRTRRRAPVVACAGLLACALALAGGLAAHARAMVLEDLLQREGFGAVSLAPGERWLAAEQRRPFAAASRFDVDSFNPLFRTQIVAADLRTGGPLRPLVPAEPGVGYQLGPFGPDGARVAVYRLTPERWELGVATLRTGEVRWLGVTPEVPRQTRRLQWLSPDRLVAIALPDGAWPYDLRAARAHAALPDRWAASARGDASVTQVGSGRYLGHRDPAPPKRLIRIDAATGATEVLAEGDFVDLEASASGRWLALVEAAEDVPLAADRAVQGPYGIAVRRMRLRLLDLATGRLTAPCEGCDVLTSLLAWAPGRDALLAYVRDDGAPWPAGRLVAWSPAEAGLRPVAPGLQARIARRPERVSAGWWGREPLLFGRRPGAGRDDWFRITRRAPVCLTTGLAQPPPDGLVVGAAALLVPADGAAWSVDHSGRARRLSAEPFAPPPRRGEGVPDRTTYALRGGPSLPGALGPPHAARGAWLAPNLGNREVAPLRPGEALLALGRTGLAVDRVTGGGVETLIWRAHDGRETVLARINDRFADVERPAPIAVRHRGPNGEALRSWLIVPPTRPGAPRAPLVVVPYPGRTYATAPLGVWDDVPMAPAASLVGQGYAVLLPSLPAPTGGGGPAEGLAARILEIVDAAARQPDAAQGFDPGRLGLWGHSFGGYAVTAVLGQTDRFAAAVAVAAPTDLASFHGQFEPSRRIYPDEGLSTPWTAGWTESLQGDMRAPPWVDPDRYRRNSPLFQADRIRTPLLLAYGDQDGAHPGQAEELFSALVRQGKDAVLLTYWGEGHVFGSPANLRDLYRRGFAFLDAVFRRPSRSDGPAGPTVSPGPASANAGPRPPAPPPR